MDHFCVFYLLFRFGFGCKSFFSHKFGKIGTEKKSNNGKRREKEREKSKGRLIVLLIQLSSVLFTHLTYCCESVAFLWILFTTYFDFYEFYSSLSPSFWMKSVQFEIDSEFISNALRQCRIIGVIWCYEKGHERILKLAKKVGNSFKLFPKTNLLL